MKLLYIGAGFVGTCSAAVSADSGHDVIVYDIDKRKIEELGSFDRDRIEDCLHEQGLGDLLVRNKQRVTFTTDYTKVEQFIDDVDAVFMCLPTPEIGETGQSDLSYYTKAGEQLAVVLAKRNGAEQKKYVVIVNKSTVPIEMVDQTAELLHNAGVQNVGVVSNPEFLVEGKAIEGALKPDRVVVGAWTEQDFSIMRNVYHRFVNSPNVQYIEVNPKEAAAGKLLANFYLFLKLANCFDVIGRVSETFDSVSFEQLRKIISSDKRLGSWGLFDSLYAGGSCFIKDSRSLAYQLRSEGVETSIVDEVYLANKRQLSLFLSRGERDAHIDWRNKKVALLGTAFKRDTNDVRNSPSIDIVKFLEDKGVEEIYIHDFVALDNFKAIFKEKDNIDYTTNIVDAIKDAYVCIIATDWPQYRSIMLDLKFYMHGGIIMDGRRILQHAYNDLQESGFDIIAVGSPFLKAKK